MLQASPRIYAHPVGPTSTEQDINRKQKDFQDAANFLFFVEALSAPMGLAGTTWEQHPSNKTIYQYNSTTDNASFNRLTSNPRPRFCSLTFERNRSLGELVDQFTVSSQNGRYSGYQNGSKAEIGDETKTIENKEINFITSLADRDSGELVGPSLQNQVPVTHAGLIVNTCNTNNVFEQYVDLQNEVKSESENKPSHLRNKEVLNFNNFPANQDYSYTPSNAFACNQSITRTTYPPYYVTDREQCYQEFYSENHKIGRKATGKPERPFHCQVCSKTFKRRSSLSTHKLIHDNVKPFQCQTCQKDFLRRSDLKKHTLMHSGQKPHQCANCGKVFSQSSNMLTHMRRHSGVRPYSCQICGHAFYRKVDVRRHQSRHGRDEGGETETQQDDISEITGK